MHPRTEPGSSPSTPGSRDDSGKDSVERPRDAFESERIDKESGVADLAAAAAAHEPPKLLLGGAIAPRRHLLECPKAMEIAVGAEDLFDTRRTERTDQLLLEIRDAHEEPELLHVRTREVGAEAPALECPAKHQLLARIAETSEPEGTLARAELLEERPDAVCATQASNVDARHGKVEAAPLGERFDRDLVAYSFDEHDGARVGSFRIHRAHPMKRKGESPA
jgi:hypothetical protein